MTDNNYYYPNNYQNPGNQASPLYPAVDPNQQNLQSANQAANPALYPQHVQPQYTAHSQNTAPPQTYYQPPQNTNNYSPQPTYYPPPTSPSSSQSHQQYAAPQPQYMQNSQQNADYPAPPPPSYAQPVPTYTQPAYNPEYQQQAQPTYPQPAYPANPPPTMQMNAKQATDTSSTDQVSYPTVHGVSTTSQVQTGGNNNNNGGTNTVLSFGGNSPQTIKLNIDPLDKLEEYPALVVKQKARGWCCELCCSCESANEYNIYNPNSKDSDKKIMVSKEHSSCIAKQCCGRYRKFEMGIKDTQGQELVRFVVCEGVSIGVNEKSDLGTDEAIACVPAAIVVINRRAYAGADVHHPGRGLGHVKEEYSVCVPVFGVYDYDDKLVYKIVGNCYGCCNYTLEIFDKHHNHTSDPVGKIKKKWSGLAKEIFTDADNFFIDFPSAATAEERALLLGALFLIDFLFFENNRRDSDDNTLLDCLCCCC